MWKDINFVDGRYKEKTFQLLTVCYTKKALSLYKDFSKSSSEMCDKSFTASKAWLHRFRNVFGLKNAKITGEATKPVCGKGVT
jgi:hypothetical protein